MERKPLPLPKGKLYTANQAGLRKIDFDADVLLITRAGYEIPGARIVRELAPSQDLFQRYLRSWKHLDYAEWWPRYEPRFLEELKSDEKIKALRHVYMRLLEGRNVVLVCFCSDHRYCHRRLVGEFFEPYGVIAKELHPIKEEQIRLF